jgi:hypothetical protein
VELMFDVGGRIFRLRRGGGLIVVSWVSKPLRQPRPVADLAERRMDWGRALFRQSKGFIFQHGI